MAPEQGPDSKSICGKTVNNASDEGSDSNNNNNDTGRNDSQGSNAVGWIYLLRKEQLIEQCEHAGIPTAGYTVNYLRKKLAERLRSKQLRSSTQNILRELEKEIVSSENSVIADEGISLTVPSNVTRTVSDLDIMSTVQKWNLQFSGDSDLMEFLERFEELAECYRIPCDRLLPTMLGILRGNALKWYRVRRNEIHSWENFRVEIQKFFLPKRYLAQIEQNFYNRKQNSKERAKDYILSLLTLARQHPLLRSQDHLDRIYDGLRSEYRYYIRRHDFSTLDELSTMTDDFEALKREDRPQASHMVAAMEYKRENTCWKCKRTGHHRRLCTFKPRIFCSYCGKDGILSRDCLCHQGQDKWYERKSTPDNRYFIPVMVGNLKIRALIDTCSSRTYINQRVAQYLEGSSTRVECNNGVVQLADQTLATCLRIFRIPLIYEDKTVSLISYEVPSLAEDVILGMDFLSAYGLEMHLNGKLLTKPEPTGYDAEGPKFIDRKFPTAKENSHLNHPLQIQRERPDQTGNICTVAENKTILEHEKPIKPVHVAQNSGVIMNSEANKFSKAISSSSAVWVRGNNGGCKTCTEYYPLKTESETDAYPRLQPNNILSQPRKAIPIFKPYTAPPASRGGTGKKKKRRLRRKIRIGNQEKEEIEDDSKQRVEYSLRKNKRRKKSKRRRGKEEIESSLGNGGVNRCLGLRTRKDY